MIISFKNLFAVFGMLRGTGQLIQQSIENKQDFYYFAYLFVWQQTWSIKRDR